MLNKIVGAISGVAAVAAGWDVIQENEIGLIVASWFTSPVVGMMVLVLVWFNTCIGGVITVIFLFIVERAVLKQSDPYKAAIFLAPYIYAVTLVSLLCFVLFKGVKLPIDTPWYAYFLPIVLLFVGTIVIVKFFAIKWVTAWIEKGILEMREAKKEKGLLSTDAKAIEMKEVANEEPKDESPKDSEDKEISVNNTEAVVTFNKAKTEKGATTGMVGGIHSLLCSLRAS